MQLTAQHLPDATVIAVGQSRIDAASAIAFKDRMRELAGPDGGRVVLDLSQVDFIDSSGLGAIVAVMKLLGDDRALDLAALSPAVDKVFRLTRMNTVFAIHADVPAALGQASLAG